MMRSRVGLLVGLVFFAISSMALALADSGGSSTRARPPKFPNSVVDFFSTDARDSLSGDRPIFQSGGSGTKGDGGNPATNSPGGNSGGAPVAGVGSWSKLITAESIEGEIKSFKAQLGEDAKTPGSFKSGGVKKVRRLFTEYAALFAIISEYDGDVKWKSQAVAARELLGRCAANCKAATDGQFQEAKRVTEDLETLLGGGTITGPPDTEAKNNWPKIADRRVLMQKMEELHQKDIAAWTSSDGEFKKNSDKIIREAELMAALCEVCIKEGYEYAGDQDFIGFCRTLQKACLDEVEAAKNKNYEAARKAVSIGTKACADCHSGYRS